MAAAPAQLLVRLAACAGLLLATAFGAAANADDATTHSVDVAKSRAAFTVTHLYLSHVSGSVAIASGTVVFAPNSATPTSVTAVLDARRISTDDADRDDDLQGPDWFDTKRFPTWTFVSASVAPGADGAFVVNGTLTTHGVAVPMVLDVTTVRGLPHPAYHATGHVDRRAFGMHVTPMDGLIGGDVTIVLDVALR